MRYIISYHWNEVTFRYDGTLPAYESPLRPGVYHLPANCTFTVPPEPESGKVIVWDPEASQWKQVPEN